MTDETSEQTRMREALKLVAVAFKDGGIPFALAGGYALWARGAPEPHHDVDFVVAEHDRQRAAELLTERGLDVTDPSEDWLFKVFVDGAMVDVLFQMNNRAVTLDDLAAAGELEVESVQMPVLDATALIGAKLAAMDERSCDLGRILPAARAVREQVDWARVAADVAGNDFAEVTLILLERLGVVGAAS